MAALSINISTVCFIQVLCYTHTLYFVVVWIVKAVNLAAPEAVKNAASHAFPTPALPCSDSTSS